MKNLFGISLVSLSFFFGAIPLKADTVYVIESTGFSPKRIFSVSDNNGDINWYNDSFVNFLLR